ncbi:hypothetical protein COO60DRAFT_1634233 [Scenedesmus sp. NREL 46B-D3]|nr:hypothetical protein COO60DRAFT_1634233 [Scenedesmus sp. NREL 46B-D3]
MNLGAARLVDLASQQREPGALQGSLVQELQQVKADITAQLSAAEAEVRAEFETAAERWGRQQADQQAELQAAVEGRISEHCSTLLRQVHDLMLRNVEAHTAAAVGQELSTAPPATAAAAARCIPPAGDTGVQAAAEEEAADAPQAPVQGCTARPAAIGSSNTHNKQHDDKTSSDGGGSDDEHGGAAGLITCHMRGRHFCHPDSAKVHMEADHPELVGVSDEGREAPAPAPAGVLAVKPDPAWRQRLVLAMAHPDDEAAWEAFGMWPSSEGSLATVQASAVSAGALAAVREEASSLRQRLDEANGMAAAVEARLSDLQAASESASTAAATKEDVAVLAEHVHEVNDLLSADKAEVANQRCEPAVLRGRLVQELRQVKEDMAAQLRAFRAELCAEFEAAAGRWGRRHAGQQAKLQAALEGRLHELCSTLSRQAPAPGYAAPPAPNINNDKHANSCENETSSDGDDSDDEHGGAAGLIACPLCDRQFCHPDSAEVHMETAHPELMEVLDEGREPPAPEPAPNGGKQQAQQQF